MIELIIDISEELKNRDKASDFQHNLLETYLANSYSSSTRKEIVEALSNNCSNEEIVDLLRRTANAESLDLSDKYLEKFYTGNKNNKGNNVHYYGLFSPVFNESLDGGNLNLLNVCVAKSQKMAESTLNPMVGEYVVEILEEDYDSYFKGANILNEGPIWDQIKKSAKDVKDVIKNSVKPAKSPEMKRKDAAVKKAKAERKGQKRVEKENRKSNNSDKKLRAGRDSIEKEMNSEKSLTDKPVYRKKNLLAKSKDFLAELENSGDAETLHQLAKEARNAYDRLRKKEAQEKKKAEEEKKAKKANGTQTSNQTSSSVNDDTSYDMGQDGTNEGYKMKKRSNRKVNESMYDKGLAEGKYSILNFPNGEYVYVDIDENNNLVAGPATNTGIIPVYSISYDDSVSLDDNLQYLYDYIVEESPDLSQEAGGNYDEQNESYRFSRNRRINEEDENGTPYKIIYTTSRVVRADSSSQAVANIKKDNPDATNVHVDTSYKPDENEGEDMEESLKSDNDSLREGLDQTELHDFGYTAYLTDAINDEYEAIDKYNQALIAFKDGDQEDAVKVIEDIVKEEYTHVGQLQELLKIYSEPAHEIKDGEEEAKEQIDGLTNEFDIEEVDNDFGSDYEFLV